MLENALYNQQAAAVADAEIAVVVVVDAKFGVVGLYMNEQDVASEEHELAMDLDICVVVVVAAAAAVELVVLVALAVAVVDGLAALVFGLVAVVADASVGHLLALAAAVAFVGQVHVPVAAAVVVVVAAVVVVELVPFVVVSVVAPPHMASCARDSSAP